MVSFEKVAGMGVIATLLTGGIVTVLVQPFLLPMIPVAGWAALLSWALALVVGFVVASCVWALVVAILLVTMFKEAENYPRSIQ